MNITCRGLSKHVDYPGVFFFHKIPGGAMMPTGGFANLKGFFLVLILLVSGTPASAFCSSVPYSHEVGKGDTLWELSGHYYGDCSLWPKMWEMNPFVTNPHLLKEGDVLKLRDAAVEVLLPEVRPSTLDPGPLSRQSAVGEIRSFDVSSLVDTSYAGFFSFETVAEDGRIWGDETERLMLSEGDAVYVNFPTGNPVAPGDAFMVYRVSKAFTDPTDGKRRGYAVTYKGEIVVSEPFKGRIYRAVIKASRQAISVGDPVLAAPAVSACLDVVSPLNPVKGVIIASRDARELIGCLDVVYLNRGRLDGLEQGNVMCIHGNTHDSKSTCSTPLPNPPLGSLIVLAVTADSASALVVDARQEIPRGSAVCTVTGGDAEALVSSLPACRRDKGTEKNLD
jgi:hypothetical protein